MVGGGSAVIAGDHRGITRGKTIVLGEGEPCAGSLELGGVEEPVAVAVELEEAVLCRGTRARVT